MKTPKLTTLIAAVMALALCTPGHAVEKKKTEKAAPEKAAPEKTAEKATTEKPAEKGGDQTKAVEKKVAAPKPLPYQGDIASIDPTAKSFVVKNKQGKAHVFTITDKTVITKADGAGTFDDIKVGEYVRGSRLKTGDAQWDALTVTIGQKEESAKNKQAAAKTSPKAGTLPPVAAPPSEKKAN